MNIRISLIFMIIVFFHNNVFAVAAEENKLFISEAAGLPVVDVPLNNDDWRWLRGKKILKQGVYKSNMPPFDIFIYNDEYSGATADYSHLISQSLGIKLESYRYNSREDALKALKEGQVDFLGTSNKFDITSLPFMLSKPYINDRAVFVSNIEKVQKLPEDLAGVNLAVVADYISVNELKLRYPKSFIKVYSSVHEAMGAVAFKKEDLVITDVVTAHYLINNNYYKYLKIYKPLNIESDGYSFVFNENNNKLKKIFNITLDNIPADTRLSILMRWGAGSSGTIAGKPQLLLTTKEKEWLVEHPVVHIDAADFQAPISFFDEKGKHRGVMADVLNKIEIKTGIKFKVNRSLIFNAMIFDLKNKNTDVISGFSYTNERLKDFIFTRPFFNDQYVFVVKKEGKYIDSLDQLAGKNISLPFGFFMTEFIKNKYPEINIIETKNNLEAFGLVCSGEADVTISTLSAAEHYLPGYFTGGLVITSSFETDITDIIPQASFVVRKGDAELRSILDKALLSIPPDELVILVDRWKHNAVASSQRWSDYQKLMYQLFAGILFCVIAIFIWGYRLRNKIKHFKTGHEHLAEKLLFMENVANGSPFYIYVLDKNGILISCNDGLLKVLNLKREDVVGRMSVIGLIEDRVIDGFETDYAKVLKDGIPVQGVRNASFGGKSFSVYLWMYVYRGFNGDIKGVVCGYVDVTEHQQLLEDFKKAKENADSASKAKTMFLATMSHEIRTPINAVVGMLELALKKAEHDVFDVAAIDVAYGSAKNLLELIGDILDVVRIESGSMSLSPERCNFREQVESVVRVFDGLARQKSLRIILDFDSSVNHDVLMDPLRLKQILSNLLSNAIKFTNTGQISIRIIGELSGQGYLKVQLWVKDTGIGISAEDQERLFQPFSQADNNNQNARQGTGLGLVISRSLCELMGGSLQLKSMVGAGTEIIVSLKVNLLEPLSEPELVVDASEECLGMLNILVVDDHRANRLLLCEQLNYIGHQVSSAEDGAQAFICWKNAFFDVVITDCNMPVMSGYVLTKHIRREESKSNREPCIIFGLTANAQHEERDLCISIGMNDCLFKPIGIDDLARYLRSVPRYSASLVKKAIPFNLGKLKKLVGDQPQATQRLLDALINSNREDLNLLLNYFDNMNISALNDLAHKVKGAALVIQANDIIKACEAVELACKSSSNVAALSVAVAALEEDILLLEQGLLPLLAGSTEL